SVRMDFAALWDEAESFETFLARAKKLRPLWAGVYRSATIPAWALEGYGSLPDGLKLLVLNADWCLDSASTVPILARLAERVPGVELGLLERDDHLELMDRYLTEGTRSIPLVILLDRDYHEVAHWGPRPAELQSWVRLHLEELSKAERQKEQRGWYARDRGETVLREILTKVLSTEY
ncbi:MAG TPA: thioredoxin family protein, partial [Gemmatimonadales bacterium]